MKSLTTISRAVAVVAVTYGTLFASTALAAPQTVTQQGVAVTTATPGKDFTMKFRVRNTSSDTYSGVKVTFHLPDSLTASTVSPGSAVVDGNDIYWNNVPLEPGQSFYPTFTFKIDSGTSLGSKLNIWVQVTGTNMEETSQNFSILAKKTPAVVLSAADVKAYFVSIYGRSPTVSELKYWLNRRTDKPTSTALKGAIMFAKAHNVKH